MQAADRWDARDSQLRGQCIDFIVDNYKEVVSSATYDELSTSPQILLDIAKAVAPSVKKGKGASPAAATYTPPSKRPKLGSR